MAASVLILEDHEDCLRVLRMHCERWGIGVRVARSAEEGIRLALEAPPDFILLDLLLPDLTGVEVLRRLRADPRSAQIPVVGVTAHADPAFLREALDAGCSTILKKPYRSEALLAILTRLLNTPPTP